MFEAFNRRELKWFNDFDFWKKRQKEKFSSDPIKQKLKRIISNWTINDLIIRETGIITRESGVDAMSYYIIPNDSKLNEINKILNLKEDVLREEFVSKHQLEESLMNRIHTKGYPKKFRGIGWGKLCYEKSCDYYKYISTSTYESSPSAKNLWVKLIQDPKFLSIITKFDKHEFIYLISKNKFNDIDFNTPKWKNVLENPRTTLDSELREKINKSILI